MKSGILFLSDVHWKKNKTLIRFANNAGGLDNITVVLLHFIKGGRSMIQIGKIFAGRYQKIINKLGAAGWQMFILRVI